MVRTAYPTKLQRLRDFAIALDGQQIISKRYV